MPPNSTTPHSTHTHPFCFTNLNRLSQQTKVIDKTLGEERLVKGLQDCQSYNKKYDHPICSYMQMVERGSGYLESNVESQVEKELYHFHSPVHVS